MPRRALAAAALALLSSGAAAVERTYQITASTAIYCRTRSVADVDNSVIAQAQSRTYGQLVTGDDDSNGWLAVVVGSKSLYVPYQVGTQVWMTPYDAFSGGGGYYKVGTGKCIDMGFVPIHDQRTCQLAADFLNLAPDAITLTIQTTRPEGCYWSTSGITGSLWMSTELANIGNPAATDSAGVKREPLCSAPGPTTTLTSTKSSTTTTPAPTTTTNAAAGGQVGGQTGQSGGSGGGSGGGSSQGGSSSLLSSTTTGSGGSAKLGIGPIIAIAISAAVVGAVGAIGMSIACRRKANPYEAQVEDGGNSLPVVGAKSSLGGMSEPIAVRVNPKKRSKNRDSAAAASSAAGPMPSFAGPVPSSAAAGSMLSVAAAPGASMRQSRSKNPAPATLGFSGVMPAVQEQGSMAMAMGSNVTNQDTALWRPADAQQQASSKSQRQEAEAATRIQAVFRGKRTRTQTALIKGNGNEATLRNFIAIDKE